MKNEKNQNHKYQIGSFVVSFLAVFIISFLLLLFIEKEVRATKITELQRQEQRVVDLENDFLSNELSMIVGDLFYLRHAYEEDLRNPDRYADLSANWSEFSSHRLIYDQIRFIDANGDEKIRINLGSQGGYSVPKSDLQNKKDRYYFTETVKLKEGDVYLSPLDLNVEQRKIEMPYKPMIRLSTPIYGDNGEFQGIIVLNYLAENMLSGFRSLAKNSSGEIILLNSDGYRLSSSQSEIDWHFMFDEKKELTFIKEFPNEWQSIIQDQRQFTTKAGYITATPMQLGHNFKADNISTRDQRTAIGNGTWYIVSIFERTPKTSGYFEDVLGSLLADVFKQNIFYFVLITIVSGIVGLLVYMNRRTYSKIKFYSEFDPLTKTLNRRAGIEKLHQLFPTDERRLFLVSLCFIDINGLKEVNDTLGHKFGDELIVSVADFIKRTIRDQDFLVRLGGDEFLIVFNGIGIEMAEVIWERIVKTYEKINQSENRPYIISVSHGIVDFDNKQKTHVDDLINAADEKMYQEKQRIKLDLEVVKKVD